MAGNVMPVERRQWFDDDGAVLNGGLVYFYAAGTTTDQAVYQDSDLLVAHAQPVVLNSAGRATIYFQARSYNVDVQTSAGVSLSGYPQDNVQATQLVQSVVGENFPLFGDPSQAQDDASYLSGATVDMLAPGSKIQALDSADITGTWRLRAMLKTEGGTVTLGLMNLTDAADTALVEVTSTSTVGESVESGDITFAASGATKNYGIKLRVTGGNFARVWGAELVRVS